MVKYRQNFNLLELQRHCTATENLVNLIMTSTVYGVIFIKIVSPVQFSLMVKPLGLLRDREPFVEDA